MATVHSYVHSKISDPLRHVQNDRFRESRRPKNVLFYPNGKPHYKPQQLRITPHKYNSFNDLLKDLTKTVKLPFGVRRVYTPTGGTEIADLDDLEDGNTYLCASFEKFKPANYGKKPVDNRPEWGPVGGRLNQNTDIVYTNLGYTPSTLQNAGTRGAGFRQYYYRSDRGTKLKPLGSTSEDSLLAPPVKRTLQKGTFGVAARDKYAGSMGHLGSRAPQNDISLTGQAKKFRIVHDMEPSKGYDFLFNERTSDNFERILQYVSETLKQNLRKFFTLKNREIKSLRELYRCSEDVLIATAKEHITEATVRAVRDAIYSYKNNSNNPSSSSGPYKTDSGFVDDLESDYDRTPRPKPHTAAKKVTSESSPQRAVIKNVSPNRKPRKRQQIGVDETEDDSSKPSDQQLSRVYQRRKERERKEREKMMTQQNERSEEDKRRRRQQARMDNERRKSVKRLTGDKQSKFGPLLGVEANKENDRPPQSERRGRSPTSDEIAVAEQMEESLSEDSDSNEVEIAFVSTNQRARRKAENLGKSTTGFDSLESAAIVKHDKSTEEQKLREQAEKAEQKRKRLQDERNRHLQKDAAEKEKEKEKMKIEKDLMALSEQAEKQRKMAEAKPVDHKAQFEEANFIKKKKQNSDEPRRLSFESEEKILKDAEQNEKDRAKKERERRRAEAVQEKDTIASFPLEEAVKPAKAAPPVDDTVELEAALLAEKKRKQKEKEDEEEKRRLEALKAEEEAKQKAEEEAKQKAKEERRKAEEEEKEREKKRAEEEARRAAEEKAEEERKAEEAAEAKRLAEEEAEKARKAAALEEAARLRKAEEERQQKEAEEKAKEEERKRQEQEEAERKKREAEKEKERQEAERKKREAEEEQQRKDAEAAAAEEKRKKDEAARKAAEEAEKEKEKVRPKGLILPIHEEEEIERKYELKKKMGDGNFANVYQALLKQGSIPPGAPPGQKEYAVKQIDKSKVVGKVQMLKNEIDIMKGCDHPNICKLYEAYETDKHVYLVMEFVKGGDLFDAISENVKFDEPQSSLIIRHLAEALDYLHSRKIVHRDIKPENLLVDKDEKGRITQVKLGDFGLAMHVKEKIYSVCGTPTYVAPEILAETGYGLEVDNWATGVISYILLCGFPPFRSIERNQDELFDTIQRGEFEYLSPYWDNISDWKITNKNTVVVIAVMNASQFRQYGKEMVDYIADYLENVHERRVFPEVDPGYMQDLVPPEAPENPEDWNSIIQDVERVIMPGMVHWQHPGFHAYFPAGNSYPSIMADMLGDGLGIVGFSWASSPACTELETLMLDWMGKMIQLPREFLFSESGGRGGGVLQGSASDCILVTLLSARSNALKVLREENPLAVDGDFVSKMVAYCSKQAHSSMEKAAMIACVQIRQLPTDSEFSLRGDTLKNAIADDREQGLIPIFVGATVGTTSSCAFDNVAELGLVCRKEQIWLHVDGAYGGNAMICPEFRHLIDGIEYANSFNLNPNKWMLVNFDCSCMWVQDSDSIKNAFNVDPLYLQHKNTGSCIDYRHWGIPLSRRFRSLKLWFVIRAYGVEGLRAYIRRHCALAKKFEHLVRQDRRFEVMNKVSMGLVCFRMIGPNRFSEHLLQSINDSGRLHMVPSSLNGKYMIRFAVCAENANEIDISYAWKIIQQFADKILHPSDVDDEHLLEQPGPNGEVVDSKGMKRLNLKPLDLNADTVIIEEGAPFCSVSELMIGPFRGRTKKLRQTQSLHLW